MTWALDLDGVIWLGAELIRGSAAAVTALRARGERVVFLTNNSNKMVGDYVEKLEHMGISASTADVVTSAQAAASLLEPGTTALVCGGPGVTEALVERGVQARTSGPADAVVVGWHDEFDYDRLTAAASAVLGGARLVGTNADATYPTPDGVIPGGGALLAAVAYASSTVAEVAGKPNPPMVALVESRFGPVAHMVGDRPDTDGFLARRLGAKFHLVLTGVTAESDLPVDPEPDSVAPDLATLVARLGAGQDAALAGQ
ncbi:MAG: HAD-IIA family hydrolase [Acidimicrobiales bacterium]